MGRMLIKQKKKHAGFTLNEILIVAAIVSILATILVAVFVRSRENGRIPICQSSLKQISLAVRQYADDNSGRFPNNYWQRQIGPYLKGTSVIQCPTSGASYLRYIPGQDSNRKPKPRGPLILSYYYNGFNLSPVRRNTMGEFHFQSAHQSDIADPRATWMYAENNPRLDTGVGGTFLYSVCDEGKGFNASLHNGGGNYAFVDGHIAWMRPDAVKKLVCADSSS